MKKLGVIGGLGPMATAYYMQRVIEMTDASSDQEHIEILIHSKPSIPDRTSFILNKSEENPMPDLLEVGRGLKEAGADILAMPCVTAHFFQKELEEKIGLTIINALEKVPEYLAGEGIKSVGIMATDGTIETELFQKSLERYGMVAYVPSKAGQAKVMSIIYDQVKAGKKVDIDMLNQVAKELFDMGAQVIVLGCTELAIAKRDNRLAAGFLDVIDVLARESVLECGKLKEKYNHLITKEDI